MKTLDIITALNMYVDTLSKEEQDLYNQSKEKNIYLGNIGIIAKLASELEKDYKAEETKKKGGNELLKRQKLFEKLLKEVQKENGNIRPQFNKCWIEKINGQPMQIFCNKYYIIALNENYFVDVPTEKELKDGFRAEKFFIPIKQKQNLNRQDFDLSEIKMQRAQFKAEQKNIPPKKRIKKHLVDIGNSSYNSQYFINCVEALGKNSVFYQNQNILGMSYFESEIGIAGLLPCRKN